MNSRLLLRMFSTFVLICVTVVGLLAQGVTTSSINGQITDDKGESLIGANVVAVHVPSGTTYGNSTDVSGYYRIPNMKVGGPYKITVSYTGYTDFVQEGVYLNLGQAFKFSPKLAEGAIDLGGVEIVASRSDVFDGNRTGSETTIGEELIESLPTLTRSLGDFTRLNPQSRVTEGSDGLALSFGGMNNRYNAIYIDGAVNNDVFGLAGSGTNGGQTGVSPISVDAIEELQVNLAPFDVKLGGFAGAAISAISRSGSNNWEGSAYTFFRNESLVREDLEGATITPFSATTSGFRIGGPIVKDKLFFFANAEIQRDVTPLPFDANDYIGATDQTGIQNFVNFLKSNYNYDPGTYTENEQFLNSDKVNLKFDYNLDQNNKFGLRFGWVRADNLEGVQSSNGTLRFLNTSERFLSNTYSTSFEWNSILNSTMSNNLNVSYVVVRDDRDPNGDPFPYVEINDGSGTLIFGSERFSTANLLNQDILTINNNFEIFRGKHNITVGANLEFYKVGNLFMAYNYGQYEFRSLDDFLNGETASFFQRTYSLVDNITGDDSKAIAAFNAGTLGMYVQDEIQATDNFKITLGVRADVPYYGDTPGNEAFNENTIPVLEEFYDLRGARVGDFIKPQIMLSPRIGFNWDLTGEKKSQLRGGVGIFTSRAPLVWVGGAYNNYGRNIGYTRSFNATFEPNVNNQLPGPIDPSTSPSSGNIDLFAEDFKLPQFLKFNVALDQKLPWGLIGNVDFTYNKTLQNVAYQNVNLRPSEGNLTGTPDNRPLYNRFDEIDDDYGRIILGYNTNEGYAYDFSASVKKAFSNGLSGVVAYSYGDSFSVFDGTSSQNSSQWRGLHSVNGRNVDQPLARSNFAPGHRFFAALTYEKGYNFSETFKGRSAITLFHETVNSGVYSYVYNNGGDIQNEDSRDRALIYVPATQNEINLVDREVNGTLYTAAQQWQILDDFIENDPYLSERRGQYSERNSNWGPINNIMDLKFVQDFTFLTSDKKEHTFQLTFDIFNFTNLLNKDWGRRNFVFSDFSLIDFEGLVADPNTGENTVPTFSVNPSRFEGNEIDLPFDDSGIQSSRWQMQIGVRYLFR